MPLLRSKDDLTYEGIETTLESRKQSKHKRSKDDLTYEGIETPSTIEVTMTHIWGSKDDLTYEGIETHPQSRLCRHFLIVPKMT